MAGIMHTHSASNPLKSIANSQNAINKILVATEVCSTCVPVLNYGAGLAEVLGSELVILHIIKTDPSKGDYINDYKINKGRQNLIQALNRMNIKPENVIVLVRTGDPEDIINKTILTHNISLCVMGKSKSRTDKERVGKLTSKIVDNPPCPLTIINPHYRTKLPKKVLITWGNYDLNILEHQKKFFDSFMNKLQAEDILFHVTHDYESFQPEEVEEAFKGILHHKVNLETSHSDNAYLAIKNKLSSEEFDMVVLFHKVNKSIDDKFNGSVSKKLSFSSDTAVMIIPVFN
ncbi:universal stress protein [Mangrovivirga sp. M17]|uniref:Universal stress protein n=1 Tax=Mangrovivirga halotolerans TaxID=2993936 RepID=A0ABT3RU49_9BACT|nr:universal stress protein [Mangrovivirga halotolerans]MCX2744772.1 universal stress protein [Mangrovivirga halotolerans]